MSYRTIKTLKAMVENVLRDIPDTRNSDITLTIEIWKRFYSEKTIGGECVGIRFAQLYEVPREDNVKRARAYFQNVKKLYLPTSEQVVKARGINIDEWRVAMGYPTKATSGTSKPSWTPPSEIKKEVCGHRTVDAFGANPHPCPITKPCHKHPVGEVAPAEPNQSTLL